MENIRFMPLLPIVIGRSQKSKFDFYTKTLLWSITKISSNYLAISDKKISNMKKINIFDIINKYNIGMAIVY